MALMRNFLLTDQRLPSRLSFSPIFRNYCAPCRPVVLNEAIGSREIVGYGRNSTYAYLDHPAFPFPAIRFREMTPELLCLREKEKGDWRNLSMAEKKTLYRASFCQTYAEIMAPTGKWKSTVGFALIWLSSGVWLFFYLKWLWNVEWPDTYLEKRQQDQLQRIIDLEINPITGISSKWDYENKKWK